MTKTLEQGFRHFSKEEIAVGCDYALDTCKRVIDPLILKRIANEVGGIRAQNLDTPLGDAIEEAILSYELRAGYLPILLRGAYVRSVGYMFGERNPVTIAKRERDRIQTELEEICYGLEATSDIDPKVNEEIARGLTGHPLE